MKFTASFHWAAKSAAWSSRDSRWPS